jgi:hypothetical protein
MSISWWEWVLQIMNGWEAYDVDGDEVKMVSRKVLWV